jgi:hypothetical protein
MKFERVKIVWHLKFMENVKRKVSVKLSLLRKKLNFDLLNEGYETYKEV